MGRPSLKGVTCSTSACDRQAYAKGLCRAHYERTRQGGDPSRLIGTSKLDVFVAKTLSSTTDECIEWPFGLSKKTGYGTSVLNGKQMPAHRMMCFRAHGPPPSEKLRAYHAAHECGNRKCVNPCHLKWKTPKENEADKIGHGVDNKPVKIPEEIILAIRSFRGTQLDASRKFGVSTAHVNRIVRCLSRI